MVDRRAPKEVLTSANRRGASEEVELSKKLGTVRVQGVSRATAVRAYAAAGTGDMNQYEIVILADGLIEPELTEEEVQQWRLNVPAREVKPVMEAILRLSGMDEDDNPKDDSAGGTAP